MKVEPRILSDGRLSINVVENDGSPVASRELSVNDSIQLMARWAFTYLPSLQGQPLILEGGSKELCLILRDLEDSKDSKNPNDIKDSNNKEQ